MYAVQRIWRHVGLWFANVNIVYQVAHRGFLVWADEYYGHRTLVHFIDGILSIQQ